MAGRPALQSLRADSIQKRFQLSSSPGFSAIAVVARLDGVSVTRAAQRTACDRLLAELATSVAGDGDWAVRHAPNVAPELIRGKQQSEFRISSAHSANWVAVGLATGADIGVDVQVHQDRARAEKISKLLDLRCCKAGFFDAWVLREAIAKATAGSLLTKHAIEAELVSACKQRGDVIRANDFAALVELVNPSVSFAAVIRHHRVMQHCA